MATEISLAQFVQQPAQQSRLNLLPSMPLPEPRCLLYGPQRSGKTTLLFHWAFHLASKGHEVVFICDRAGLDQNPPLLPFNITEQHPAFNNIKFKYIHDLQHLKNYGACLHLIAAPPSAIIIDDLSTLLANSKLPDKRARDTEVTKALAYLIDGLDQLREIQSTDVTLLVSDTCGDEGPHNMYLLQRWFPLVLSVEGTSESGVGRSLLTLRVASKDKVSAAAARAAINYSLTQTYLHVESVAL